MHSKENILFGYSCTPSYGCFGMDDGGFSVEIHSDGSLWHKTYIFDMKEKTKSEHAISEKTIKKINEILNKNSAVIKNFFEHISNGSLDGSCNRFVFLGKEIISWNVDRCDEEEVKERNPQYYNKYISVIKQENLMLDIFEQIVAVLKTEGIDLKIYSVSFQ